jgi:hypothetical protein
LTRFSRPTGKTGWENRSSGCRGVRVPDAIAGVAGKWMGYHIPEYREVNWTCQEEEVAEDKAAAKAEERVEDRAEVKAAGVRAAEVPEVAGAAAVWDPEAAKGRGPRIYAAARLVGPACRTNAGFRAFR